MTIIWATINSYVIADAIRLTKNNTSTFTWDAPVGTYDVYAKWTQDPSHASDSTLSANTSDIEPSLEVIIRKGIFIFQL